MSNDFDIKDILIKGWNAFKPNSIVFISLGVLSFAVSILINVLFSKLPSVISVIPEMLINSYFILSIIKASLIAIEGQKVSFNILKNNIKLFLKFFLVWFILSIIFILSGLLLIIPLFLAFAVFFPVLYITVEKPELNIIDIFKKSWKITTKNFINCLLYILITFIIFITFTVIILLSLALIIILGLLIFIPFTLTFSATPVLVLIISVIILIFFLLIIFILLIFPVLFTIPFVISAEAYKRLVLEEKAGLGLSETNAVEISADTVKNNIIKE